MADNTNIEWADSTANLWIGCSKVSPGCDNCYAKADWEDRKHRVQWGPHGDRSYCAAGWSLIAKMQRRAAKNGGVDPNLGRKRRIFVNSLSDFFDNHRSITWRAAAFDLFEASPDVILILVTKRPENVVKMVPPHWLEAGGWPAHVWLLVSVEDQERANHRIPILLSIPEVNVRGISAEPLLGTLDLSKLMRGEVECPNWEIDGSPPMMDPETGCRECCADCDFTGVAYDTSLQWVIAGGESGPGARPMAGEWAQSIVDQCQAAGVAVFVKQLSSGGPKAIKDIEAFPEGLRVREMPNAA